MSESFIITITSVAIVAWTVFIWYMGFATGQVQVEGRCENDAVKQGHAEYYLDENHQRQWRWLPNQTRKE